MTECTIVKVDPNSPEPDVIAQAVGILTSGGLVVSPTETRYGLLGRADRADVVERVYQVKKRSRSLPTAIFIAAVDIIERYAMLDAAAGRLARRFLPGPLTLVLSALSDWGSPVTYDGKIGIRISPAPVMQMITARVDFPLTATSANVSGETDSDTIEEIAGVLGDGVALYLDGGALTGTPSTVVDCTVNPPQILREGAIGSEKILSALENQTV
jgi:L-threonylcarbamoyladenylate synthase